MFAFLPLKIFEINLRWLDAGEMPFFHQPLVNAFMRNLLGSPSDYEQCWAIHTPETGQLHYATGDWYRFYCVAFPLSEKKALSEKRGEQGAGSINQQGQLFEQLSLLPKGDHAHQFRGQFGKQLTLVSIRDALTQESLDIPENAQTLNAESIQYEAEQWHSLQPKHIHWQWLSPVRISTPKTHGKGKDGVMRHPQHLDADLLYSRLGQSLQQLHNQQSEQTQKLPYYTLPNWRIGEQHLFWVDCSYQSQENINKALGGLAGGITLSIEKPLTLQQWQYLVAGQYLGIGLSRGMGFGRYKLLSDNQESTLLPMNRVNSLQSQISAGARLQDVWQQELKKLPEKSRYAWQDEQGLSALIQKVSTQEYQPQPWYPKLIDEHTAKPRLLLLPDFRDKVLQKSASLWLSESLDNLYSYASYGYRKGRSRLNVKDKVQNAWRQGFRWVVDADIRSFFQTVSVPLLLQKLKAIYGEDPLWPLLEKWLTNSINRDALPNDYQDFQLQGLPLGSPISPVLANLMLDDFDSDMEDHNLQLIRYADDFIILCKTKEQAEKAQAKVEASLQESGFELNEQKTRITSFAKGFHFLGYFFFNDIALESKANDTKNAPVITHTKPAEALLPKDNTHQFHLDESNIEGVTLSITGEIAYLHSADNQLQVTRNDETLAEIPWQHLGQVILFGSHHITTPALRKAIQHNIPVHFADSFGHYQGISHSAKPTVGQGLWLGQIAQFADENLRMHFAKSLMQAKIGSQHFLLEKRLISLRKHANRSTVQRERLANAKERLNQLVKHLQQAEIEVLDARNIEHLLGIEGRAAAHYWEGFGLLLDEKWGFDNRNKNPPRDPVNALLSYGYSMLYSHTDTLIRTSGLYPWLGGYHCMRGDHKALASDLMEPFRYYIDNQVLTVLNKYKALYKPESFTQQGNKVLMNKELRKHWMNLLITLFQKASVQETQPLIELENNNEPKHLTALIMAQNQRLISWIRADINRFEAWRAKVK